MNEFPVTTPIEETSNMNSDANVATAVGQAVPAIEQVASTAAGAGSREFRNLIADIEDLIKRVAHIDDHDLARVRAKLEHTLESAKASLHNGKARVRTSARQAAQNTDEYVHSNPWSAVGVAAATGAAIAVLLATRIRR